MYESAFLNLILSSSSESGLSDDLGSPEVPSLKAEGTPLVPTNKSHGSVPSQPEITDESPPGLSSSRRRWLRRRMKARVLSPVHPDEFDAPTPRSSSPGPSTGHIGSQSLNDVVPSIERSSSPELLLPESPQSRVAPGASAVRFEAAEFPIQPEQRICLSELTALQKVSNDSTTPACVNKDDAKTHGKGKRKAPGTTSNDPGKGRPLKRAKSDRVTARKHNVFYISDANTVIEVDGVRFKLHRSRLVTKSSFFAQLLERKDNGKLPNDNVRVEIDGKMTVYHLSNITVDDFVALLKFDDNTTEYCFQPLPPFSVIAPILRAATALRFETYRAWAVRALEMTWSPSLADLTPEQKENAADVILLARSCGVNSGVKRALYELAKTQQVGLHDNDVLGQPGLEQLGRTDQRCVELMKELFVTTWSKVAVRIVTFPCIDPPPSLAKSKKLPREKCPAQTIQQATWDERVHDSGLYTKFLFDPVCGAQALIDIPWEEEGWCSYCIKSRRATWTKMRQNLWSDMDKWITGN
ncbi:hypothetical protein DEU56DRAFT_812244, partial [Suillus clintonianus]|uniref:uncharacterized protein n=1 Tax=Suillus clintonianus TaxID=1904413 RepID=UPI001B86DC83